MSIGSSASSPVSHIVLQVSRFFIFFLSRRLTLSKCTPSLRVPSAYTRMPTSSISSSASRPIFQIMIQVSRFSGVFFSRSSSNALKVYALIDLKRALYQCLNVHLVRQLINEQSDLLDRDSGKPFFVFFSPSIVV